MHNICMPSQSASWIPQHRSTWFSAGEGAPKEVPTTATKKGRERNTAKQAKAPAHQETTPTTTTKGKRNTPERAEAPKCPKTNTNHKPQLPKGRRQTPPKHKRQQRKGDNLEAPEHQTTNTSCPGRAEAPERQTTKAATTTRRKTPTKRQTPTAATSIKGPWPTTATKRKRNTTGPEPGRSPKAPKDKHQPQPPTIISDKHQLRRTKARKRPQKRNTNSND